MKGLDNPRRFFLSTWCNQVVVTNGEIPHVLSMPTGYYTFSEFIEAVGVDMVKVLSLVSMTIEDDYVRFNDQSDSWYFDRSSVDTTIDGFGWTPWFKLSLFAHNLYIERSVESVLDPSGPSLPDVTNDQGLGGNAYLDPCFVEYDWEFRTSDNRFIEKPLVRYTITNSDGSLFGSGTFYVTEDTTTSLTMKSLTTSCFDELNARYTEIRGIPSLHQKAIAWVLVNDNDYTMSWSANDYAPDLELSITSNNTPELVVNVDKRGGSMGPWYSKDCVYHDEEYIDTTHIVVGLEGYSKTESVIIPRGVHIARSIVQMIANGFNAIAGSIAINDNNQAYMVSENAQWVDLSGAIDISNILNLEGLLRPTTVTSEPYKDIDEFEYDEDGHAIFPF